MSRVVIAPLSHSDAPSLIDPHSSLANMDMDMDVAWCLTCSKRTVSVEPYVDDPS